MFGTLVEKELKTILLSPKFVWTFGVSSLLLLLSVFIGIQEFNANVEQYDTARQLALQEVREETSWWGINNRAFRAPDPMQIFVSGINNDVGRLSTISTWEEVKLEYSNYAEDTIFAVFRFIDFAFIVQVVLSLFAILFTYNAINGERETGTLKLALSNAVPRGQFVLAKFVGSWLGLVVPLLIPILLAVLVVLLLRVPMEPVHWMKLATLIGASLLYFTFFVAFALLVSALTRHSAVSFLILLVAWVVLVLITPRAATMAAAQIVEVPSIAEIEAQRDRFSTDRRDQAREQMMAMFREREQTMEGMSEDERQQYRDANRNAWDEERDALWEQSTIDIAELSRKLNEDLRNQKQAQERLALTLARFSPASAYQLTAMNLSGTNTAMKSDYEDAMRNYRTSFAQFVDAKREEERERMRREAERRGGNRRMMMFGGNDETLDTSELPRFEAPEPSYAEALKPSIVDLGILSLFSIAAFAGAFGAFLRYDVR